MGEYAQQYALDRFGVDIGDDSTPTPKPPRRFGCSCGRMFATAEALSQHKRDAHSAGLSAALKEPSK